MKSYTLKTTILIFLAGLAPPLAARAQSVSWQSVNGPQSGRSVLALGEDADGHTFVSNRAPLAVYRSSNDGATWEQTDLVGRWIHSICGSNNGMVFAAARDTIFRSSDHGMDWEVVTQGLDSLSLVTLCVNPQNVVFAGDQYRGVLRSSDNGNSWVAAGLTGHTGLSSLACDKIGTLFAATTDSGVYRSTDDGGSWKIVDSLRFRVSSFAVNALNEVLAGGYDGVVYRSYDSGQMWVRSGAGLPTYSGINLMLTCSAIDTIWAGTSAYSIFRSTNDGASWSRVKTFGSSMPIAQLLFSRQGTVLARTDGGGVFRSTDRGYSWSSSGSGLGHQPVVSIVADFLGNTFAACDVGVFMNPPGTVQWQNVGGVDSALSPFYVESLSLDSSYQLLAGATTLIFRTEDLGQSWSSYHVPGYAVAVITAPTKTIFAAVMQNSFFEFYGHIFRSSDAGISWTPVYAFGNVVYSFAVAPNGDMYAASNPGILKSTDDGLTWRAYEIGSPLPTGAVTALSNGCVLASAGDILYRTTDAGTTWQSLGASAARSIALLSVGDSVVYAATLNRGVLRSTDLGVTWTEENIGLTDTYIPAITLAPDNHLVCGTNSKGVFRSQDPLVSVNDRHTETYTFFLAQNYPNPFNPSTTIKYELPRASQVSLAVYDVLGREVSVLVNERTEAGLHEVKFDGSGVSSGVYFYRLRAGDFVQTRKLLLLR